MIEMIEISKIIKMKMNGKDYVLILKCFDIQMIEQIIIE